MVCLAVALFAAVPSAKAQDQVPWAATLQEAQRVAQEQRKLVLVHFYNDHCPPCERVEREVFASPRVAQSLARNYVPVKVHAGAQPKIAEQFRVDRWPTDIVCTPAGLEIMRSISPQKPEAYVGLFDQVALQAGVGAATQWRTAMQAAGQQVMDSRVAQAQALSTQAAGAAQGYANQAGAAVQGFAQQAQQQTAQAAQQVNQATQQAQGTVGQWTQRANSTAQQLGNQAQQINTQVENAGRDLRSAWSGALAGAAAAAAPTGGSIYDQFGQPAAGAAVGSQSPLAPQTSAQQSTPAPSAPSLPTANPFIGQQAAPQSAPQTAQPPAVGAPPPTSLPQQSAGGLAGSANVPSPTEQTLVPADKAPPIALEGYCPVTLVEQRKWKAADRQFGAIHRDRTYLFASEFEQRKFLANPDAYSVMLSGLDPVLFQNGANVDGKRSYGLTYNKRIYLFATEQSLQAFKRSPHSFDAAARQAMIQAENRPTYR